MRIFNNRKVNRGKTKMGEKLERIVYNCDEAGQILGISRPQVYLGIKRGEIPHTRVGKRILIPRAALEKMLGGER